MKAADSVEAAWLWHSGWGFLKAKADGICMRQMKEGMKERVGVAWLKARCGQGREAEGAGKPWSRLPSLARLLSMPA